MRRNGGKPMRKSHLTGFVCLALLLGLSGSGVCQEEEKNFPELILEPSYVAMFKNGLGIVVADVELPSASGTFHVHPLPEMILGSFWLSWPEGISMKQVRATEIRRASDVPAISIQELLEANIGKTLGITYQADGQDSNLVYLEAKILDIPKRHEEQNLIPLRERILPPPSFPPVGQIVILQPVSSTEERKQVLPIHWVKSIYSGPRLDEMNLNYNRSRLNRVIEMTANADEENAAEKPKLQMTFMAKGVSWSPSYIVDISDEEQARISAKAVLINDLIPIDNASVELITGYPHIQFKESQSAFSLAPLQQFLTQLGRGVARDMDIASNIGITQQRYFAGAELAMMRSPSMPDAPMQGETTEDLFFYPIENVTLKKGERGYVPLFAQDVPYEHLYTWEIPDSIAQGEYYQGTPPEEEQIVWHTLKLTNTTSTPWTTAPAMTVKNNRVLGQDTIDYTAPGAVTDLKITRAAAIQAEYNEFEVERQRNRASFYQGNFDLVLVRGELVLTNYTEKAVQIEITKTLSGQVREAERNPEVKQLAKGLRSVNPRSQLVWKQQLEPGRDNALRVTYLYEVYVRN